MQVPSKKELCEACGIVDAGLIAASDFAGTVARVVEAGAPLALMYATDERAEGKGFVVRAAHYTADGLITIATALSGENPRYPSVTALVMAAHWYERLMHDQFGIIPEGHPDFRRLMHHENVPAGTHPLRKDFAWDTKLAVANEPHPMHAVEGKGVYEIPVGPIHAGIIEPGHFRFNVRGERILTLEGKLFFKHKGVEKLAEGKSPEEAMRLAERISGDMVVGHALAYAEAVEHISGTLMSERARALRVLWNELERVTAHVFDIGNMAGNGTGFTFMAVQGFRMVENLRRLHESLVGHRYLRGAITLGGAHDVGEEEAARILSTLATVEKELKTILDIAFANDGLMERFETTGILKKEAARAYGARGLAARASGINLDLRARYPYAGYHAHEVAVITDEVGDVAARFRVRARECEVSFALIRSILENLPAGAAQAAFKAKEGSAYGWNESWRGAVIDWVRVNADGRIDRLVVTDPSFMNWALFGELAPGNIIPDFPLCNKSLNLSYSGTDL